MAMVSLRCIVLIVLALIAPWVLRCTSEGEVTPKSPIPLQVVAHTHGAIKALTSSSLPEPVSHAKLLANKPSSSSNSSWLPHESVRPVPSRDLRRLHRSRLTFKDSLHSRRRAELLKRKFRRSLRAKQHQVHALPRAERRKNSSMPNKSNFPVQLMVISGRSNQSDFAGTWITMLGFKNLKEMKSYAEASCASLVAMPRDFFVWDTSQQVTSEVDRSSKSSANPCMPEFRNATALSKSEVIPQVSRHLFDLTPPSIIQPDNSNPTKHSTYPVIVVSTAVIPAGIVGVVCCMLPTRQQGRLPPSWGPERESQYPFSDWARDILLWTIMSDWDNSRKAAAILSQLSGGAQEFARQLPPAVIIAGGSINGVQVDPVTYLMHELSSRFGRMSEEVRLESLRSLFEFHSKPNERIDTLLERFDTVRARAAEQGRLTVSWEGLSWILLRAIGVSDNQLLQILLPFQGSMPSNQMQFDQMRTSLRRMGHILENTPGNVSQALRGRDSTSHQYVALPQEDFQGSAGFSLWADHERAATMSWANHQPSTHFTPPASSTHVPPSEAFPSFEDVESGTDTDTSSDEEDDSWGPNQFSQSPEEAAAYAQDLYWAYSKAKRQWRSFMGKPTRRVRRFLRKRFSSKGKGKGKLTGPKGKAGQISNTSYLTQLSDNEIQSLFPASVSRGKHWRKSSGKGGKGRKGNPRGPDGKPMQCHGCGSTEHLIAKCPRRQNPAPDSNSLFVYANSPSSGVPLLSTSPPSQPEAGVITSTTVLMVTPGDETDQTSLSSWNQVDPWQGAHLPQRPQVGLTPEQAWMNYRPVGAATNYGPQRPQSTPDARNLPEMLGRFMAAGRQGSQATNCQAMPRPLFGTSLQQEQSRQPVQTIPSFDMPVANVAQPANANPLAQADPPDRYIHVAPPPPPELPAWATLPSMHFLHGLRYEAPAYRSPYQADVVSSLDHFSQQRIEAFHQAAQMIALPCRDRRSAMTAATSERQGDQAVAEMFHQASRTLETQNSRREESSRAAQELETLTHHSIESHQVEVRSTASASPSNTSNRTGRSASPAQSIRYDGNPDQCSICQEAYQSGNQLVRIVCRHTFHQICWDSYVSSLRENESPECPNCRGGGVVISSFAFVGLQRSPQREDSRSAFPWWPEIKYEDEVFHSSTQLEGHSSILVDPGAYTNLVGADWAAAQARIARDHGETSYKVRMEQPLNVKGVGNGSQQCTEMTSVPISIPRQLSTQEAGEITPHSFVFQAPTVEGSGRSLPALLGLKSLSSKNAVLEMTPNEEYLTFPGPGGYHVVWEPGAVHIPLERAPSGHLCFRADFFKDEKFAGFSGDQMQSLPSMLTMAPSASNPAGRERDIDPEFRMQVRSLKGFGSVSPQRDRGRAGGLKRGTSSRLPWQYGDSLEARLAAVDSAVMPTNAEASAIFSTRTTQESPPLPASSATQAVSIAAPSKTARLFFNPKKVPREQVHSQHQAGATSSAQST